jgi:hypothetical protein
MLLGFCEHIKRSSLELINFVTKFFVRFVEVNAFKINSSRFFLTHSANSNMEAHTEFMGSVGLIIQVIKRTLMTATSYPYYFDVNDLFGQKEFAYLILNEKLYKLSIIENGEMRLVDETK